MSNFKKMDLKEICNEVDLIIAKKNNRNDYKFTYLNLLYVLPEKMRYDEVEMLCETILKIARNKSSILRYLESIFWEFATKIVNSIIYDNNFKVGDDEELLPRTKYGNRYKNILSIILGLSFEILALKEDNSKGSVLRRSASLNHLEIIISYYHIPNVFNLLEHSIKSKHKDEQLAALNALAVFALNMEYEFEDDLVQLLDSIMSKTNYVEIAFCCFETKINAGIISEMSALREMNKWKDENMEY